MKTALSRSPHWCWLALLALLGTMLTSTAGAASAGLAVSISDNRTTVVAGSDLTYTLVVSNTSGGMLTNVDLDAFVPANTTFVGASDAPSNPAAGQYRWSFPTLANGASVYRYITVKVAAGLAEGVVITANAQVDNGSSGSPLSSQDTTTVAVPLATLTPSSLTFAATNVGTTSAAQTVQIKNTGSADLSIQSITVSGDFAQTTTCPAALGPNQTCSISVAFTPTASGARTGTLTLASNAASSPNTVALNGTGTKPVATLGSSSLTFGPQFVNTTSAAKTVTLTNSGNAPLTISSIVLPAGAFAQSNTCPVGPATLAANASCSFSVTFTPTVAGAASNSLSITTDGGNVSVALSGTGIDPQASLAPANLAFSGTTVGSTSAVQSITLTNSGTSPLTISSIQTTGDFNQTNTCPVSPATLAASATCTINITFQPTAVGNRTGQVRVVDDAANSPQVATLSGTGQLGGLALDKTRLDFGGVTVGTTSSAQQVTLTNSGSAPLTLSSIATTGDFAQTNTCPTSPSTLAVGANCVISVTFTPTVAGSRGGTIRIDSDAPSTPNQVVLAGNGIAPAPAATLDRASIDFGSLDYAVTSAPQVVTLTNDGTAALTIASITASGDFAVASTTCPTTPATLAIGASCQISLTFTPTAGGARTGNLSIVSNAPGSPQRVALTGSGIAARYLSTPGIGSINMSGIIGSSSSVTITVTNGGTALLNVAAPAESIAAPFSISPAAAYTVAAGANAVVVVTCAPTAAGPFSQTVSYSTNDPAQPTAVYSVTCSGTTVPTAGYAAAPAPGSTLAFGDVLANQSGNLPLVISESGTAALTVGYAGGSAATAITGANASSFSISAAALPLTIADGGAAQTLTVQCRPQAAGPLTATLALATNDPTQPTVSYPLTCTGIGQPTFTTYLPLVVPPVAMADLTAASLSVRPTTLKSGEPVSISVVVRNAGTAAATGFWVDLYINPNVAPTAANTPWQETCAALVPCYGLAWYVESLEPGASITLTSAAGSFRSPYSNWANTLAAGTTDIYVYVDSWNRDIGAGTVNPDGAVRESNETNNRAEVHGVQVMPGAAARTQAPLDIPARPRIP